MIFIENQYQELELWYPLLRLREEGIEAKLVGPTIEETFLGRHGFPTRAELVTSSVNGRDFDGIIIPGGFAPDYLRRFPVVLNLVREFYQHNKLIGTLSRGPWVLISADIVRGKRVTGLVSVKDDVNNAGGEFVDAQVVVDGNIITARGPDDLPLFMQEVLRFLWQSLIRLGDTVPDGRLTDASGHEILLSQCVAKKPAVLFFFDSVYNPRAVNLLPTYNRIAEAVHNRGGLFLGVSADSLFVQRDFLARYPLSFPLYSDMGGEVSKTFGVFKPEESILWAVFIVDRNCVLRYREYCPAGEILTLPGFEKRLDAVLG